MVEGECLVVVRFGLGWFAQHAQCGGEVVQAGGLVAFCSGDVLVEGECLAVVGFGIGWLVLFAQCGGEVVQAGGLVVFGSGECLD